VPVCLFSTAGSVTLGRTVGWWQTNVVVVFSGMTVLIVVGTNVGVVSTTLVVEAKQVVSYRMTMQLHICPHGCTIVVVEMMS
jgi:hypothetical protein